MALIASRLTVLAFIVGLVMMFHGYIGVIALGVTVIGVFIQAVGDRVRTANHAHTASHIRGPLFHAERN